MPLRVWRLFSSLRTTTRLPIGSMMSYSARRAEEGLAICIIVVMLRDDNKTPCRSCSLSISGHREDGETGGILSIGYLPQSNGGKQIQRPLAEARPGILSPAGDGCGAGDDRNDSRPPN